MKKTLGISAEEYIMLLQVEDGLPVNDMDFMFLKIHPYKEEDIRMRFEQPMINCFGKVVNKIDSVEQLPSIIGVLVEPEPLY